MDRCRTEESKVAEKFLHSNSNLLKPMMKGNNLTKSRFHLSVPVRCIFHFLCVFAGKSRQMKVRSLRISSYRLLHPSHVSLTQDFLNRILFSCPEVWVGKFWWLAGWHPGSRIYPKISTHDFESLSMDTAMFQQYSENLWKSSEFQYK